MGSEVDALKLSSSLTLFAAAGERLDMQDFVVKANASLDAIARRYRRCPITVKKLQEWGAAPGARL